MDIRGLIDKLRRKEEPEEEYEAKPIVDRYLDSLRRERQTQMNEQEKYRLKQTIADYKKARMRKMLYGIGDNQKEKSYLGSVTQNKVEVLNEKRQILKAQSILKQKSILRGNSLLNNRKEEFKKAKKNLFV